MNIFKYYSPKCTLFGYGCLAGLAEEINSNGYKKGLIITDTSLIQLGIIKKVTEVLDSGNIGYAVFDGVCPNPTITTINQGLKALKAANCDFTISVGGGSAHDCAKAIAMLSTNGGRIEDYRGVNKSNTAALPIVAINTTAGTASECTQAYVVVDEQTNSKVGSRDKNVLVSIAVDDHELMMDLPRNLTAGTGMDALTHAIECYISNRSYPLTRALAESAVRVIFGNLAEAVLEGSEKSRENMATGQYLAGLAFGNAGCGLVHAMSHQLSAVYDLPHGLSNAILLPTVMRFNCKSESAVDGYASLACLLFPIETHQMKKDKAAGYLIDKIENLSENIGTRQRLTDLGVKEKDLKLLAEKSLADGSLKNNPVQPSIEEVAELFRKLL